MKNTHSQHKLLTVSEAAQLKKVSRASVYSAIARQRLPHQRILGHLAVREADVLAWVPIGHKGGRPKGSPTSAEARARMSEAQKRRWAARKNKKVQSQKGSL